MTNRHHCVLTLQSLNYNGSLHSMYEGALKLSFSISTDEFSECLEGVIPLYVRRASRHEKYQSSKTPNFTLTTMQACR